LGPKMKYINHGAIISMLFSISSLIEPTNEMALSETESTQLTSHFHFKTHENLYKKGKKHVL